MIEGVIWALKQTVLHAPVPEGKVKRLSVAEYALLSDTTCDLKGNGEPIEQTKYLRLPENIRFTFAILKKYFGPDFDLGVGTAAWDYLLAAHKIRHRITHPKTSAEITVSDDEIETCIKACSWFNELVVAFFNGVITNAEKGKAKNG